MLSNSAKEFRRIWDEELTDAEKYVELHLIEKKMDNTPAWEVTDLETHETIKLMSGRHVVNYLWSKGYKVSRQNLYYILSYKDGIYQDRFYITRFKIGGKNND